MLILWLLLLGLGLSQAYYFAHRRVFKLSKPSAAPSGPFPLPIFGNALSLLRQNILELLYNTSKQFNRDGVMLFWVGHRPFIIVNDASLVKSVFSSKDKFEKGIFANVMKPLLGDGLLLSEGTTWRRHHTLAGPAFQSYQFSDMIPLFVERIETMFGQWNRSIANENLELKQEFSKLTLDNVGILAFGSHFNAIESKSGIFFDILDVLSEMQKECTEFIPIRAKFPRKYYYEKVESVRRVAREKIAQRKQLLNEQRKLANNKRFLLDVMIEAESSFGLTDKEVEDEMVTAIMGGHDTTASAMSWMAFILATEADVATKIRNEFESIRQQKSPHELTKEDLDQLNYTANAIKECLRLYPSAPILNRRVVSAEGFDLGNYHLPTGTEVLASPWVIQRNDKYWPDPLSYIPERWNDITLSQAESQCIYFPFSHGPRKCLGQQFSFLELKLITAMLVSRYTLRRPSEKNIKAPVPDMAITLYCQNGLWMKLRPVDETPNAG
jgi:cytochrome P450